MRLLNGARVGGVFVFLLSSVFLTAVAVEASAAELKVSAGVAAAQNIFKLINEPFLKETGIKIVMDLKGLPADQAFTEMNSGKSEVAVIALPWEDIVKTMKIADENQYFHTSIGGDRIRMLTNEKAGVKKLDEKQIADIFSGKVRNWKAIGGADLPIQIFFSTNQKMIPALIQKNFLRGSDIVKEGNKNFPDVDSMIAAIRETPGAIGYAPLGVSREGLVEPDGSEIRRPINLIVKGAPSTAVGQLLKFIRENATKFGIPR